MRELGDLKEPGQSYDELLGELVQAYREYRLAKTVREKREGGEFVEVDPDDW